MAPLLLHSAVPESPPLLLPTEITTRHRELRTLPLGERIKAHSQPWLGRSYSTGPIGEGGGFDSDPMVRFDTFDCLTFVEEVLALSLAPDPVSTQHIRLALRYKKSVPKYENRRHFMLAEWIPELIEQGWLKDITPRYSGAIRIRREVNLATWKKWSQREDFGIADKRFPVGIQEFWYLPLERAIDVVDSIPDGAILFTVRQPRVESPIAITHVGIKIPGEKPTMRHASTLGEGGVKDNDLTWYLGYLQSFQDWPAVGIIILMPLDFGPRQHSFE